MKLTTLLLSLTPLTLALPTTAPIGVPLSTHPTLSKRQYLLDDTQNQLLDSPTCSDLTLLFARGTTEPGNVGLLAGPPFFQAVANALSTSGSSLAVQGVDYGATIAGFLEGGDPVGAATLAGLVGMAVSKCPGTKVVLGGYSQGGQVVHLAAAMLTGAETAAVDSGGYLTHLRAGVKRFKRFKAVWGRTVKC